MSSEKARLEMLREYPERQDVCVHVREKFAFIERHTSDIDVWKCQDCGKLLYIKPRSS